MADAPSTQEEFVKFQHGVLRLYGENKESELDLLLAQRFGSIYTNYRKLWNSTDRQSQFNFPLHLDFELNDSCNQACIMCPRNIRTHQNTGYSLGTKASFDLHDFKKILEEGQRYGLKSINLGAYAEPLTHPHFFDFVSTAASYGIIDIRMITNGMLLTRETSDSLLKSAITNIFISIDAATKETYASIRGSGYDLLIKNIEYLLMRRRALAQRIPFIRVSYVHMNSNKHELSDFLSNWHKKVDFIDVQLGEDLSADPFTANTQSKEQRIRCISPWQRLSILANGDIIPCCSFYGRYIPIGNIKTTTIYDAWHGHLMQSVRQKLEADSSDVCKTCQTSSLL
jgi:radical SAM protein with 4Fe4S-binding SPASM domain